MRRADALATSLHDVAGHRGPYRYCGPDHEVDAERLLTILRELGYELVPVERNAATRATGDYTVFVEPSPEDAA